MSIIMSGIILASDLIKMLIHNHNKEKIQCMQHVCKEKMEGVGDWSTGSW